jgi:hypothetical protein
LDSTERGDELVRILWTGSEDPDRLEEAQLELLHEISEGYPVEGVRRLLASDRPAVVRAGAWVASELGTRACPLVGDMASILDSSDTHARFFAVDVVLLCGSEQHGQMIARVIELVDDPAQPLRWKALQFLTNAAPAQLATGSRQLQSNQLRALTEWLVHSSAITDVGAAAERLIDHDRATRLFAVAAMARKAIARLDPAPLVDAVAVVDQEVAAFASWQLDLLAIRRRRVDRSDG